MKSLISFIVVAPMLAIFTTGCSVNSSTVSNTVSQVETAAGQTAAYQSAKATVDKWVSYIGITPVQAQQLLPTVQDYYTQVANTLSSSSGSTTKQKLASLKDSLTAKLKTTLTAAQVSKAIGYL